MRRCLTVLLSTLLILAAVGVSAPVLAQAATQAPSNDLSLPLVPASIPNLRPAGFSLTPAQAVKVAETSPTAISIHRRLHPLHFSVYIWTGDHYEVYFAYHGKLQADVIVQRDGRLGPTYTGPLILGIFARNEYGGVFDSPWVLIPFTLMFLLPLVTRRLRLAHLDVLAVLGFGVSYALFDTRHLEAGVWLAYVPLLYLLGRMLWRGRSARMSGPGLSTWLPLQLLAAGLVALVAGRIFLTLEPKQVVDVGTASAVGAYKILHGQSIYYSTLQAHGDTYGPIAYLAYAPFQAIWPGSWTFLPSVRAATITFDLVTIAGLIGIGVRFRAGREGLRLGLLMAWLWAACPFTVLAMIKNTNDGLVAMLLVLTMLSFTRPIRRGILLGLAAAAKFSPAVLLGLLATGPENDRRGAKRVVGAFVLTVGAAVALFLPPGGLQEMWNHTIGFQLGRSDVFSPWGLHPGLAPLKVAVGVGVLLLVLAVTVRPRGSRSLSQTAALAAALMIAVQLPAMHWFYFYILWFFPLVLIAVLCGEPATRAEAPRENLPEPVEIEAPPVLVGAA